jgi:hypothetical protein
MKVRILLVVDLVMKISSSSILPTTILGNISEPSLNTIVGVQSLQVMMLWPADLRHTVDEVALWVLGTVCTVRDMDRAVKAVVFRVASAMVCLKLDGFSESLRIPQSNSDAYLFQKGKYLVGRPSWGLPRVEVCSLSASVHHKIDRRASTKRSTAGNDGFASSQFIGLVSLVEQGRGGGWQQVIQEKDRVLNALDSTVILSTLN